MSFRDLAGEVASQFQQDQSEGLREAYEELAEEDTLTRDSRRSIFTKINFKWKAEDKNALTQVRAAVGRMMESLFSETYSIIDELYGSVRVPVTNEHGVVATDEEGRYIWQKDDRGRLIEDWSLLDGMDIEKSLLDLERVKLLVSTQVSELYAEALFAKNIYDDRWHDEYESMLDGTQGDRSARAVRNSSEEKYHSFFRYLLWERANTFLKELQNLMRLLERIRDWRIRSVRE